MRYERPWLTPYQLAALFTAHRYGVCEASAKSGKTAGCMVWLTEQAMQGRPGQNFWWVAPVKTQADIVFRRLKRALPRELYTHNETHRTLTLANDTTIWFKGSDEPDTLYGEDVYAAVIDEASRCRETAWHAVRTTLTATQGPIRIIGNVKGRKNWAHHLARKAEAGEPNMHYARITAHDAVQAGILAADEIEDAQRQLPAAVFRELYLAEPSDDQGNPFGAAAIRACLAPLSNGAPVAWGYDLAKSVDWTVGIALDAHGAVCRFERWQGPWEDTISRIVRLTGDVPALVDSSGVGDPVLEQLQKRASGVFTGFKFSATSKQQLCEGLAVAIQQRAIHYPEGPIAAELDQFEYVYSRSGVHYAAAEGVHDDCVIALALAVQQWQHQRPALRFFLDLETAPKPVTQDERDAAEAARVHVAAQAVTDAITREGVYWPGGG